MKVHNFLRRPKFIACESQKSASILNFFDNEEQKNVCEEIRRVRDMKKAFEALIQSTSISTFCVFIKLRSELFSHVAELI
jgi:hypothetical protein